MMGTAGVPFKGQLTLEAKLDSLGHKLDQLFSGSAPSEVHTACAYCNSCSLHTAQQEAIVSMLSAQAHRLETLERLVLGMGLKIEPSATGAGRTTLSPDNGIVPEKPLSSTTLVPIRNSCGDTKERTVRTTEKRNQVLKQQNICGPQQRGAKNDLRGDKVVSVDKACTLKQDKGSKSKLNTTVSRFTQPAPSPSSKGKTGPQKTWPPGQEPPQHARLTSLKNNGRTLCQTLPDNSVGGAEKQEVRLERSDPPDCPSLKLTVQIHSEKVEPEVTIMAPPPSAVEITAVTPSETEQKAAPSLLQENLLGVMIPKITAQDSHSTLKHVHSCPVSLQRLQDSGGNLPLGLSKLAGIPLLKTCSAGAEDPVNAAGIHIAVSTAPDCTSLPDTPKPLPHIAQKILDDDPPHPAPFPHRVVTLRSNQPPDTYIINTQEVLGGGRFGTVHSCIEKASGLKLAAKILTARCSKERSSALHRQDMSLNEIQVMNQLSHPNIIQLYDAYEIRSQAVLILEFVEGGELFERILDESFPLTELDAMIFIKQICEGIQYMHQMYVLHLDLKPENILCVNRKGHQVKIIDFGLARRYKPREKLRVSVGTPEFLAPEIVNFDFVSFPTDMWAVGVITYMLLSGLSPFMGDDDTQTLNNVLSVNWYFDEETFEHISPQAKDFVSNLLIRERSGRLSATQCLRHPWLHGIHDRAKASNILLKSQVQLRKYMAKRMWKKNYIAIAAANRFKKISSSGSLTTLAI